MNAAIVSDVHLGSEYCLCSRFVAFVRGLPAKTTLVLNGDTVDRHARFPGEHLEALDLLRAESSNRKIVWVRGNHDRTYMLKDPGAIEFRRSYSIDTMLYVMHGRTSDVLSCCARPLVPFFRIFYHLHVGVHAESMHVAFYAKRWPGLYSLLRERVALTAVRHARRHGYDAVTCGHVHCAEDRVFEGVRYINTGSWTESPIFFLSIKGREMVLKEVPA